MLHKVQIESRIFPVWEQRIPYLVTPGKENLRLRRLGLKLIVGSIASGQIKMLCRKAVKSLFFRQHTEPSRKLCQEIRLTNKRLIILGIANDIQPEVL